MNLLRGSRTRTQQTETSDRIGPLNLWPGCLSWADSWSGASHRAGPPLMLTNGPRWADSTLIRGSGWQNRAAAGWTAGRCEGSTRRWAQTELQLQEKCSSEKTLRSTSESAGNLNTVYTHLKVCKVSQSLKKTRTRTSVCAWQSKVSQQNLKQQLFLLVQLEEDDGFSHCGAEGPVRSSWTT